MVADDRDGLVEVERLVEQVRGGQVAGDAAGLLAAARERGHDEEGGVGRRAAALLGGALGPALSGAAACHNRPMPTCRCHTCGTTETGSPERLNRYWLRAADTETAPRYCGVG